MWSVITDYLNGSWGHYTLTALVDHEVNTHCVPGWVLWWIAHLTVSMCHVVNTTLNVLMGHVVNTHWMAQWIIRSIHTDCVNGSLGQYTLTVLLCHVMNTHWLSRWVMWWIHTDCLDGSCREYTLTAFTFQDLFIVPNFNWELRSVFQFCSVWMQNQSLDRQLGRQAC